MTIDQLNTNNLFCYARKSWVHDTSSASFDGVLWRFISSRSMRGELSQENLNATDWYETTIPNPYYKEEQQLDVTKFAIILNNDINRLQKELITAILYRLGQPTYNPKGLLGYGTFYEGEKYYTQCINKDWATTYNLEGNTPITAEEFIELFKQYLQEASDSKQYDDWVDAFRLNLNTSACEPSSEQPTQQKENTMDLKLLLAMMAAMSETETPKDATNSKHVIIVTKDGKYEGYFYADSAEELNEVVRKPENEGKKFHMFDYNATFAQKPRKVVPVERS